MPKIKIINRTSCILQLAGEMSIPSSSSDLSGGYVCKICGLAFLTPQALAAHVDSEHPEAEQPEIL